ncbi:MAG: hypothetical protein MRJ67_09950 [Nitrospirales bacterium]|nr:hypothetical protein [Nitrospira sp.]MDR4460820.1 hypothetical protein [Nitrospirales bacterium]
MKRLCIPIMVSVVLLGTTVLGNINITRASNHHEAPMVHLDSEAQITNFYAFPKQPTQMPSANQVSVGAINSIDLPGPTTNLGTFGFNQQIQREGDSKAVAVPFEIGTFGKTQHLLEDVPDRLQRDPVDEKEAPALKQFFSSIQTGQPNPSGGLQAGDPMNVVVESTDRVSNSHILVTLTSSEREETVQVLGTLSENVGAGIFDNRRVGQFTPPHDLPTGFYSLSLSVGLQSANPVLIEISDSASLNRRRELTEIIQSAIGEKYSYPYALVGPYSPLPMGSQINDSITGETIATIDQPNMWLFFAYDPEAFFGQSDARWVLIDGNSENLQIIENREFGPAVTLANGEPYALDYGSHDHVFHGVFATGPYFQNRQTGSNTTLEDREEGDGIEDNTFSSHAPIIGLSFSSDVPCPPEKVNHFAFIVTLDDTDKRFEELIQQEKKLLRKLGIPTENMHELNPEDFLIDGKTFAIDNKGWSKSFSTFRKKLEEVIGNIDDCCAEVLIIVNAHGTKSGNIVFKKAEDVPWKKKYTKKEGILEVKPQQHVKISSTGVSVINSTPYFKSGLLATMVAEAFKKMKKTCIPVGLLMHSCYSGKIEGDPKNKNLFGDVNTMLENFRVFSSSSSNEQSYGRIESGNYRFPFLEAISLCLLKDVKDGEKTLEAQWACIVEKTKELAKEFGKKQTPTKYPTK